VLEPGGIQEGMGKMRYGVEGRKSDGGVSEIGLDIGRKICINLLEYPETDDVPHGEGCDEVIGGDQEGILEEHLTGGIIVLVDRGQDLGLTRIFGDTKFLVDDTDIEQQLE
jgi:hypothetical protein